MAWSSKTSATQLATITSGTEQFFDTLITLGTEERAAVQLSAAFPATASDAIFSAYRTLDASSEVWDTEPEQQLVIPAVASSTRRRAMNLRGGYKYRIGVKSAGANNVTTADASYRTNGVNP